MGSQEVRSIRSQYSQTGSGGKPFLPTAGSLPAETWSTVPGSHPLLHLLRGKMAESVFHSILPQKSQKFFPQTQNQDLPIPKSHLQEVLKEKKRQGAGTEGRKKEGSWIWLCLRKKNKTQSLSLPSFWATNVRHLFGDKALNVNWMH